MKAVGQAQSSVSNHAELLFIRDLTLAHALSPAIERVVRKISKVTGFGK
jgi:hypothetical protein